MAWGVSNKLRFIAAVEFLGSCYMTGKVNSEVGRAQLFMLEPHGDTPITDVRLPENADWKDVAFAESALGGKHGLRRVISTVVLKSMRQPRSFLGGLSDPRYRMGWFEKASMYLMEVVSSTKADVLGPVVQHQMTSTSTILKVRTSRGLFFLKSPTVGCREASITAKISVLFPAASPSVLASSLELNCYITEGFNHDYLCGVDDLRKARLTLGQVQLGAVELREELIGAGCPSRNIGMLAAQMRRWTTESGIAQHYKVDRLIRMIPVVTDMCARLMEFNIPETLTHGDFALGNAAYKPHEKTGMLLFDWEFAHIGHAFCDFHRVHNDISSEVLEEYLKLWSSYESLERARAAFEIAQELGWFMKMWALFEWIAANNAQNRSFMANWMISLVDDAYFRLLA